MLLTRGKRYWIMDEHGDAQEVTVTYAKVESATVYGKVEDPKNILIDIRLDDTQKCERYDSDSVSIWEVST